MVCRDKWIPGLNLRKVLDWMFPPHCHTNSFFNINFSVGCPPTYRDPMGALCHPLVHLHTTGYKRFYYNHQLCYTSITFSNYTFSCAGSAGNGHICRRDQEQGGDSSRARRRAAWMVIRHGYCRPVSVYSRSSDAGHVPRVTCAWYGQSRRIVAAPELSA